MFGNMNNYIIYVFIILVFGISIVGITYIIKYYDLQLENREVEKQGELRQKDHIKDIEVFSEKQKNKKRYLNRIEKKLDKIYEKTKKNKTSDTDNTISVHY